MDRGNDLISLVLKMTRCKDSDHFNGYLSFELPRLWNYYAHIWPEKEIKSSLKIAKIINQIQMARNSYKDNQLIVELKGLVLFEEHREFLDFWFDFNKQDFFEHTYDKIVLVHNSN